MIQKYGEEEGTKRFAEYCSKQVSEGNTLDYFVTKYGEEEGTKKHLSVCKQKGITLDNFIRKYGEEEGPLRYHKNLESRKGNYISKLGREVVTTLSELIPSHWMFHEGVYGKEFCVYQNQPYFYDFVITNPFLACVEINGDYWHGNPELYPPGTMIHHPNGCIPVEHLWERDRIKQNAIEARGYAVYILWEIDYNRNKQHSIDKVLKWLKSLENE
jgi:hypothetical protein